MAMKERVLAAGRKVNRHRKKIGAGLLVAALGSLGAIAALTLVMNRRSFEERYDLAFSDIASGPRQQVYQLVLQHERIVRALAARGAVRPPLLQTDAGVIDPVLQAALQPPTLAEKLRLRSRPDRDPEALVKVLQQRDAELVRQLDEAGGSRADLEPDLESSALAPPEAIEVQEPIVRPGQAALPQPRVAAQGFETADRLKALCAAKGGSADELGDLCKHPEELATQTR
jgi:hypothetical protein